MLLNAGRKAPKLFSRRQHQVPVNVIFYTVVCCGSHGGVTDAAFVLNFSGAVSSTLSLWELCC